MADAMVQRAFVAGELSPALAARADLRAYATGLTLCRNCFVRREGGIMNRPGTKYVATAGDTSNAVRLIPFVFEAGDQTYMLEFGQAYIRFFWHGAPVLDGPDPYEVVTTYDADDLVDLQFIQSADVLTLTHPSYPPRELRRNDHTDWTIADVTTAPSIDAPTALAGAVGAAGARTRTYVVTAYAADTFEESSPSSPLVLASGADPTEDAPNTLSWTPPTAPAGGIGGYYVYCDPYSNGIYGFIGEAAAATFNDVGFAPDFTVTPPVPRTLFAAAGDYPAVATYYQQRRWFARSNNEPEKVWASRVGAYANFSTSTPLQDDDAVEFVIASRELNPVNHLIPLSRLILLTDAAEWLVRGDDTGTVVPASINPDQVGYVGSSRQLRPLAIGDGLVYGQARNATLRDLRLDTKQSILGGRDLTLPARHRFQGHTLKSIAWQQEPDRLLWAVRDDGVLLGATYAADEDVIAWHAHDTGDGDVVEDVAVIPDTSIGEDVVYLVVRRTIDGSETRYIERLASRFVDVDDAARTAFFVDCGATYDGAAASVITGLDHLEGMVVAVLGDGVVVYDGDPDGADAPSFTVASGQITLPTARSVVHVGLPIRFAEIETLEPDVDQSNLRDRKKNIKGVTVFMRQCDPSFAAGPDADTLFASRRESWKAASLVDDDDLEAAITSTWAKSGRVRLRHTDPTPWHVVAIAPLIELGG